MSENEMPLVSVVIPCYNHQDFVQQAIQSVIDQDYSNIELIIIDDGSLDNSATEIKEMIAACEERFKRFEFRSRTNIGLCATLNESLEWCKGEFFSAIASDDIWLPYKTKVQVKLFNQSENTNIAVISGEMIKIDSKGKAENEASFVPPDVSIYNFLDVYKDNSRISAPTAMIRMQCLRDTGGYNSGVIIEDFYMWLAITNLGNNIMSVKEPFAKYRIHDNNTFSKIKEMSASKEKILQYFSPNQTVFSETVLINNIKDFKAAAVYQKSYAIELLLSGKINLKSTEVIPYIAILFLPKKVFFKSIDFYRSLRKS